ncbi:beta/alpha barrel domain-containing protein [Anaerocolumna xylanovorans]|uniref:Haloacid dehalogenase-like hydrolase n=1 Tax=Anaerocolumna xylanovorans DSM 12503 TaxID=1121345 RepID=A0A1M7XWI5_9FIRM|nr:hypothetical protein [Anaerocolumna xylanovorans]SHO43132.1 hypothetical protein SAMN02745217_00103 [Anaerocolumna xylanovorans DSM 12503]
MDRYIILDIDRTIINGTSWYHACTYPDLLIREDKIESFKELNNNLYNRGTFFDKESFRKLTFELISKNVTEKCINILEEQDCAGNLFPNQYINNDFLECIGLYTIKKLVSMDDYCIKIISMIQRYYTGNIKILFLTSGYASYMKGLLSVYMDNFKETIDWSVIGSDLSFHDGNVQFEKIITQTKKYYIVNEMISQNNEIVLLADDSQEDRRLFDVVGKNGGYAFNVQYNSKNHTLNWDDLYKKINTKDNIKKYLTQNSEIKLQELPSNIAAFFKNHCNEIGILQLNKDEFLSFCDTLNDAKLCEYVNKMVYEKDQYTYLRGYTYYFWLPPYINMSLESKFVRWKKLYTIGCDLIRYINKKELKLSQNVNLLTYMACDHLLAALYLALYCMEEQNLNGKYIDILNYQKIQEAVCVFNHIVYLILEDKNYISELNELDDILNAINVSDLYIIDESKKYLLELDNYMTVFTSAKSIVEELDDKVSEIDSIVCFGFGGIAIGYALQAIINLSRTVPANLYTSHYSSKRFLNEDNLIKQIPIINQRNTWKDNSKILLVDNNATTFKTLQRAKKYLIARKNEVYCAVAEVDYNNVCSWILDEEGCEEMCDEWYDTLDFSPINEYISAYNTWGTSQKSVFLEHLYLKNVAVCELSSKTKKNIYSKHRKICRVHNIYDLKIALSMGATMIGIHAVINKNNNYYDDEIFCGNHEKRYPNLPVPDYEVDGIRYMIAHLPPNITPVLVIENELTIEEIKKIAEIYGLSINKSGIQFQFSINENYLNSIINMGFAHLIISVGIMQNDIFLYLENISMLLREENDYLLLDMSKHQPQLIAMNAHKAEYSVEFEDKFQKLQKLVDLLKKLSISILLADDLNPDELILCQLALMSNGVNLVGLDMQNNIELHKSEQGYCKIKSKDNIYYYAKIRKSIDKIKKWQIYESCPLD